MATLRMVVELPLKMIVLLTCFFAASSCMYSSEESVLPIYDENGSLESKPPTSDLYAKTDRSEPFRTELPNTDFQIPRNGWTASRIILSSDGERLFLNYLESVRPDNGDLAIRPPRSVYLELTLNNSLETRKIVLPNDGAFTSTALVDEGVNGELWLIGMRPSTEVREPCVVLWSISRDGQLLHKGTELTNLRFSGRLRTVTSADRSSILIGSDSGSFVRVRFCGMEVTVDATVQCPGIITDNDSIALSRDGSIAALCTWTENLWLLSGRELEVKSLLDVEVQSVAFLNNDNHVALSHPDKNEIVIAEISARPSIVERVPLGDLKVRFVKSTPKGDRLFVIGNPNSAGESFLRACWAYGYASESFAIRQLSAMPSGADGFYSWAVSESSNRIALATPYGRILVWKLP